MVRSKKPVPVVRDKYEVHLKVYYMLPQSEFRYDFPKDKLVNGVLPPGYHQYFTGFTADEMEDFAEYCRTSNDLKLIGIFKHDNPNLNEATR